VSAMQRTKGATAEREVVRILRDHGWDTAGRTSDGRNQHGRNDIVNGPEGCAIEIKRHERLNVPKALDQLMEDANEMDTPILVHRPSRHVWMATLPLDDLLELLAFREKA
jgi:Holliday junction resolvase